MTDLVSIFSGIVGSTNVLTSEEDLKSYGTDWTKRYAPCPKLVVLPGNTEQVSAVVKYCNENEIAIVPSGGRTGLAGGAVAANGEVVLSLTRMSKILAVDAVGMTIRAEAGVTTQALQEAADEVGLYFPIDLAAKGSCQVGGNVATNAGGVKLIRYGGTREQVLGLEVVLPNGDILDLDSTLRKNNTGYDLKHLFIASEGTLGIVTKVTMKLVPKPKSLPVCLMATDSFAKIPGILGVCNKLGITVTAFEFFTRKAHEIVLQHIPGAKTPFGEVPEFFVLLEIEENDGEGQLERVVEEAFNQDLVQDGVFSSSSAQHKELWGLRENITEAIAAHGHVRKNDISLGVEQLTAFIGDLEGITSEASGVDLVLFGHIGDGNLHINYSGESSMDVQKFNEVARETEVKIFDVLKRYKGSISAEHGVGLLKKQDLADQKNPAELAIMRRIKKVFDPKGIMNPGKIFDL